ncbi:WD40 domain-containing protein [Anabaenopsis elenkinii]|uniref:Protein kinase domain-containing protein n=1 Tax=Anabaenopsis elenkinii CCIBt3563 TaxID=2779889 RepID=A0A7S6U3U4_9CYAN|nr:hypothetical protein [Anabaenopsis elenkinii]QOV22771.1 hypothetical protein IM676_19395 [Anabaenopsis elenkinii CCIBt3563]
MTRLTCASTGKSINLLSELANSGEAKVWRTDHSGYLAKIYHQSTPERMQKLAVMLDYPPPDPNHQINHISFAWPRSVLKNAQGDLVGFLMGEIRGGKEIYDVYNPTRRNKICKLPADWRFLHYTARNIASIIKVLHHQGYVLGDIKPQNILVNDQALPSIIDTDSFQVRHPQTGKVHHCLVGTPEYTPPELIGQDFATIEQTEIHDRFRLGVIIYQLLFSGQNLYAGMWKGAGEPPEPGDYIRQGIWLYSHHQLLEPVARTIPLEILHPQVKSCFLRCFNDGYKNPNLRPSAEEWFRALKVASESLILCKQVESHYYSQSYGSCYWCDRVSKIGVEIFPGGVRVPPPLPVPRTNVDQLELGYTLTGHSDYVYSVGFSPYGQTIASGSRDNTIKLWDVQTGKVRHTLTGHSSSVVSVGFSPDGQTLVSGSGDKTIKLWDVQTGNLRHTLTGHSRSVTSVGFSPDGQTLASGSVDKTIKLWDVHTGKVRHTLTGHSKSVNSVGFSPDGQTLASGSHDKTIKLWDVQTGKVRHTLTGHSGLFSGVRSVGFSPDGQTLASGSDDNTIKLWDVQTGKVRHTLTGHSEYVKSVGFSPDGQTLVSGSDDKTIKLWDVRTGKVRHTLTGHSEYVNSVGFSPDGQTLASGSRDKTIKLWRLR